MKDTVVITHPAFLLRSAVSLLSRSVGWRSLCGSSFPFLEGICLCSVSICIMNEKKKRHSQRWCLGCCLESVKMAKCRGRKNEVTAKAKRVWKELAHNNVYRKSVILLQKEF